MRVYILSKQDEKIGQFAGLNIFATYAAFVLRRRVEYAADASSETVAPKINA